MSSSLRGLPLREHAPAGGALCAAQEVEDQDDEQDDDEDSDDSVSGSGDRDHLASLDVVVRSLTRNQRKPIVTNARARAGAKALPGSDP